jgi:hypothetical protein
MNLTPGGKNQRAIIVRPPEVINQRTENRIPDNGKFN